MFRNVQKSGNQYTQIHKSQARPPIDTHENQGHVAHAHPGHAIGAYVIQQNNNKEDFLERIGLQKIWNSYLHFFTEKTKTGSFHRRSPRLNVGSAWTWLGIKTLRQSRSLSWTCALTWCSSWLFLDLFASLPLTLPPPTRDGASCKRAIARCPRSLKFTTGRSQFLFCCSLARGT